MAERRHTEIESAALAVVHDFVAAWNSNDMSRVLALMDEDVFYHNIPVAPLVGRRAVSDYLGSKGGFDWINWQLLNIAVDGHKVLTERVDDFSIGGVAVSLPIMGTFEVHDGKIKAWRDYFDMDGYRRQLAQPKQ
ncbi:limonene-1,2-epoxide hydrolase family protein [Steroidobacter sp.]|uniref:limonene-1,2-epoxide hydrolase family protein n=1 Tax=Steroidobacter sp. TaxID=1978227 RepID=UPI001A4522BF|nr:limonene-1,2-epoxide hydrolase family protein [Steroidobacter sp.]MBL8268596.1 nuclear transport factor 2 family protein [Steroidobacter sp.]